MTKPCKFKAGVCIHCGDTTRINVNSETCEGWNPTNATDSQTLADALAEIDRLETNCRALDAKVFKTVLECRTLLDAAEAERDALKKELGDLPQAPITLPERCNSQAEHE